MISGTLNGTGATVLDFSTSSAYAPYAPFGALGGEPVSPASMPLPTAAPTGHPDELVQRGRIILDIAAADLEASERSLGPFHPTTLHFRSTLEEARRAWERLRAHWGVKVLTDALEHPPRAVLSLSPAHLAGSSSRTYLIIISGQTYSVQAVPGSDLAPVIWKLARLPDLEDGPYHACRLNDGSLQCDCAQWVYQIADNDEAPEPVCKHLAALQTLGWI